MTHASLFSGIGGPEVAAQMLGWENIFHCEINPFGRAILEYHFPNSVSYEDITKTDFTRWNGRVDVLTGGFPCQPFSYAGKRGGANDDRYLWPQMLRAISECRPTWVVGENVAGITTMVEQSEIVTLGEQAALFGEADTLRSYELRQRFTIERVCTDLENIGYAVQPVLIPACAVGAPHRRDRVFIIGRRNAVTAHSDRARTGNNSGPTCDKGRETCESGRTSIRQEYWSVGTSRVEPTSANDAISQDPVCGGQLVGWDGERGSERNERHVSAGDSERLCDGASGTDAADTADERLEHNAQSGSQREMSGEKQERNTELHVSVAADGCGRTTADTEDNGLQHGMRARRGESESERDYRWTIPFNPDGSWNELPQKREVPRQDAQSGGVRSADRQDYGCGARWSGFPSVTAVHRGNDGLPFNVDNITIPFVKWRPSDANLRRANFNYWRTESLKAYGNAIVPQVMYEIFRAIEIITL